MDIIVEFFEILFNIYIFLCVVVTTIVLWTHILQFDKIKNNIGHENSLKSKSKESNVKFVKIESHGTLHYMFEVDSDKFICQSSTEEELWETAQKLNPSYKLILLNEEIIMSNDDTEIKITFAPGCFDEFEGSQEELNDLIAHIREMVDSGELFENSRLLDESELTEEEQEMFEKVVTADTQRKLH
jgi:hypothetical protein